MLDLAKYAKMSICVAVSGGRDSMALLHFLHKNADKFGITLSALNCEHGIRGEQSKRDSKFVKDICKAWNVRLMTFECDCIKLAAERGKSVETVAREWRKECYLQACKYFSADAVATAHHLNDNAETVLFNLARGSALAGLAGICDTDFGDYKEIRPFIDLSREEIDEYIAANGVPYVEDETNASDGYTRNYIRHNVIPALEKAVPSATKSIYRFSRFAAEDEEYFDALIDELGLVKITPLGAEIAFCEQKVIFRRAAVKALKGLCCGVKDYTAEHLERLYELQRLKNGKKFEFLSFTACKEEGKISIYNSEKTEFENVPFGCGKFRFSAITLQICRNERDYGTFGEEFADGKILNFDYDKIPTNAVIRLRKNGDIFQKFGGGTKSLGDFFTDCKIPQRLRDALPVIACGSEVLLVCGVEISDKIKVADGTKNIGSCACNLKL